MRRMYSENQVKELALEKIESTQELKVFESIVDKDGHARFIEGVPTLSLDEGTSNAYAKWSLSGTHLMFVLAGQCQNSSVISSGTKATYVLPEWVMNKIIPLISNGLINRQDVRFYADDQSYQAMTFNITKTISGIELMQQDGNITLTKARNFRIQFDLLIDNE